MAFRILYIAHACAPRDAATISTFYRLKALKLTGLVEGAVIFTSDPLVTEVEEPKELKGWLEIRRIPFPRAMRRKASVLSRAIRATVFYLLVLLAALKIVKEKRITHLFTQHHHYHLASLTGIITACLTGRPCIMDVHAVSYTHLTLPTTERV
mgnify:CR=1 FL=1